ncbi:MAG: pentapeptide repeat-containing protein, partial [Firmicutes bacterium]|nr:pentapeptide repeat-containing protein [Bacillota bacterium]
MHPHFVELSTTLRNEKLLKMEVLFVAQKKHWLFLFNNHLQSICKKITTLQTESTLPAISFLEFTQLYTNIISRRYVAEIWVYDDKLYLDKNQLYIGEYDLSFLLIYFDDLWNSLLSARKQYVGKVTSREIKEYMLKAIPDFLSYFISIVRFAIRECIDKKPLIDIKKNEEFIVNVGNYMASTESVYAEYKNKDADKIVKWFEEGHIGDYVYGDYSKLDFSGRSFISKELRYSFFCHSCLKNTFFQGSVLIGTSFHEASMENCHLDYCFINEADFSHARLNNASFVNVDGRAGLPNEKEWHHVGFLPVNFRHADLTNT